MDLLGQFLKGDSAAQSQQPLRCLVGAGLGVTWAPCYAQIPNSF